jgi:hypothetical protein
MILSHCTLVQFVNKELEKFVSVLLLISSQRL